MKRKLARITIVFLMTWGITPSLKAQEINARVNINHTQIQGAKTSVFESLRTNITEFLNTRQWTRLQFGGNERINCSFNITVTSYDETTNRFTCNLLLQSNRPVFNSSYTTVVFSMQDANFNFIYQEFDRLDYKGDNQLDNNLTAMLAYYAYLIIGFDLDTMSFKGGSTVLQIAQNIVNNAQNIGETGWKAFDDSKNRYAIINDYMEGSMEAYRQLQYEYHRSGLDQMADNPDFGRANITTAMQLLASANENRPMSLLPQIFTDYKRDEIINIFSGRGTQKEKEDVYNIVSRINAAQYTQWEKIKN